MTCSRALLALAIATSSVHADPVAEAIALFDEGQRLFDAGKVDAACDAFQASVKLDPQLGAKLNLANCRERQLRFSDAYKLYEEVQVEAARTGKTGRETFAKQRLDAIRDKVGRFTLEIAEPRAPGLVIRQIQTTGTIELTRAEWELPRLANAGPIVLEVSAPDRTPIRIDKQLVPDRDLQIAIPVLARTSSTQTTSVANISLPPAVEKEGRPLVTVRKSRTPMVLIGVGSGLVLASFGLGIHAKLRYNDAFEEGSQRGIDEAKGEAGFATLVGIFGVVGITTGVVLHIRWRDKAMLVPTAGTRSAGITAIGSF